MLDFATKKVLKLKYNHFRMFVMPILVRNDNFFVNRITPEFPIRQMATPSQSRGAVHCYVNTAAIDEQ